MDSPVSVPPCTGLMTLEYLIHLGAKPNLHSCICAPDGVYCHHPQHSKTAIQLLCENHTRWRDPGQLCTNCMYICIY